jgi:hydroxypyruvate isomerase
VTLPDRLAANVAWLFTELPWGDRFAAARAAGFSAVEFPWPDDPAATTAAVREAGLRVAVLNMAAGDLAAGERGWPNDPARVDEWRDAFATALSLALQLGCPTINVLAGNAVAGVARAAQLDCLLDNLSWALPRAGGGGITIVTEPLNRRENPDYLVVTLDDAEVLGARLGPLGWRLQLDLYHLGCTEPDLEAAIRRAGPLLRHLQVADLPDRHEPGSGSVDWPGVAGALQAVGYAGFIGLEYRPAGLTLEGLGWIDRISFDPR